MITFTLEQLIEHFVKLIACRDAKIAELDASLSEMSHSYAAMIQEFNDLSAKHKALLEQPRCE